MGLISALLAPLFVALFATTSGLITCSGDAPKCIKGTPDSSEDTPIDFKVAFYGDQGLGADSVAVLHLVKSEGAHAVVHSGDFDYKSDPEAWENQINSVLGNNYPYFASIGNHDVAAWGGKTGYQQRIYDRLVRLNVTTCRGEIGVNTVCTYKGLAFVLSGAGTKGSNHARFIEESFGQYGGLWRFCSWHKNMKKMQTGDKSDETGWEVYESCRRMGGFVATGHEHEYSRTKLLSDFTSQTVVGDEIILQEGHSFAFVSGVAGVGVRTAVRSLESNYWARALDSDKGLKSGALFCTFNQNNISDSASCYFKQIDGVIQDQFNMTTLLSRNAPGIPLPRVQPGHQLNMLIPAVTVAGAIILSLIVFVVWKWRRYQESLSPRAYNDILDPIME